MNAQTLTVDDLELELRFSPRRRSVQVTVDRGGELLVLAPEGCSESSIEDFVRQKRYWIYTKLAEKEAFHRAAPQKQYVSGEGFPYLGRNYRLLLVEEQDAPVKLERGRFRVRRADAGREAMVQWYRTRGNIWLARQVARLQGRIGVTPGAVVVRDLGYRWGSCGKNGAMNFHWRSILLPVHIAEYIVAHELVHLLEPHHTPEFWSRLERLMPDFVRRKQWLAENAAKITTI